MAETAVNHERVPHFHQGPPAAEAATKFPSMEAWEKRTFELSKNLMSHTAFRQSLACVSLLYQLSKNAPLHRQEAPQ
jgi:hypothetical protein